MRKRIVTWAVIFAVILFALLGLQKLDTRPARDHLGRAVACSRRFPFKQHPQAEILEYGLQDPRGLACDKNSNRVFVSEANRALVVDWPDSISPIGSSAALPSGLQYPDPASMCPGESCANVDQRGLAISGSRLFSAEHGRQRIGLRTVPPYSPGTNENGEWLVSASSETGEVQRLTGPSGLTSAGKLLFITDDGPRRVTTAKSVEGDQTKSTEGATGQLGGAYVCAAENCLPESIGGPLRHPTGITAVGEDGPIFVAETDSEEVRWPIFVKSSEGHWSSAGLLGSASIRNSAVPLPSFLGIAVENSGQIVFAAGPGGLYIFDRTGTVLGRILFDEPVTGVSTRGSQVYLAVGHMLCLLTLDDDYQRDFPPTEVAAVTPPRDPTQPSVPAGPEEKHPPSPKGLEHQSPRVRSTKKCTCGSGGPARVPPEISKVEDGADKRVPCNPKQRAPSAHRSTGNNAASQNAVAPSHQSLAGNSSGGNEVKHIRRCCCECSQD